MAETEPMPEAGAEAKAARPPRQRLTVGVYIPCYNASRYIGFAIASLLAQRRRPDRIIVVDDGSTDDSVAIASRFPIQVVCHQRNRGLSAARNTGIEHLKTDVVASIDADCVAHPDWLARLMALLELNPHLMGVAGRLDEWENTVLADRWRARHLLQHWGEERVVNPRFLFGANTLYRRSHLLALRGYQAAFRTNGEDYDLSRRMMKEFPKQFLLYEPAARVHHLRRDTIASVVNNQWRYLHFPRAVYHPSPDLKDLWLHTRAVLLYLWTDRVLRDLRDRQWRFAAISAYALCYSAWMQVAAYRRRKRREREIAADAAAIRQGVAESRQAPPPPPPEEPAVKVATAAAPAIIAPSSASPLPGGPGPAPT
ncbi:MAG: hypothetical protein OHK0024_24810 [Thalassobaculales bacterium]